MDQVDAVRGPQQSPVPAQGRDKGAGIAANPKGKVQYIDDFDKAADGAVKAGVWLQPEATNFKAAARLVSFG